MKSAGGTEDTHALDQPKEPQRRSPVNGTQATATPLRPAQTAATSSGARDAPAARKPHRQTTARTHWSEPSLPVKRSAPGHANHQRPNAKRQGTHGRSDQTEDAKAEHERTSKPRAKPTEARRDTRQKEEPGTTEPKDARRQTHRLRNRQRTKDRHRHRSRKARPAPEQTTRRAQETQGNQGSRTHRRRTRAKPTPPGPTGTKNIRTAKRPKNKNKTDGSWRQAIEGRKVASPETTIGAPINAHDD